MSSKFESKNVFEPLLQGLENLQDTKFLKAKIRRTSFLENFHRLMLASLDDMPKNFFHLPFDAQRSYMIKTYGESAELTIYNEWVLKLQGPNIFFSLLFQSALSAAADAYDNTAGLGLCDPYSPSSDEEDMDEDEDHDILISSSPPATSSIAPPSSSSKTTAVIPLQPSFSSSSGPALTVVQPVKAAKNMGTKKDSRNLLTRKGKKVHQSESIKETGTPADPKKKSKKSRVLCDLQIYKMKIVIPVSETEKNHIRDILIYDIPAKFSPENILNELTAWGKTLSISTK
ncbi:hypothetical protein RclHR1_03330017 [Rhizophagus clarus]|uniref:Uncharacterized protein n=1 Tax=Rhizophagus clarus TaxID=94130 RepID=A0A2Z6R9S6_9GLOM|nr:hypothetical protein RclHR1_03330017 [Rhizophagus clarus]GET03381.1 hypothetical protein GLOIN_2v1773465 [Rhizophagus clarus]